MNLLKKPVGTNKGNKMKAGDHILLRATCKAQRRTKNRIRENGKSGFIVLVAHMQPVCLSRQPALLLESVDNAWRGWLPCKEVEAMRLEQSEAK